MTKKYRAFILLTEDKDFGTETTHCVFPETDATMADKIRTALISVWGARKHPELGVVEVDPIWNADNTVFSLLVHNVRVEVDE